MKKIEIAYNFWNGKAPKKEAIVPHTCYKAGSILKNLYNKDAGHLGRLYWKPAYALASAHDATFYKDLMVVKDKDNKIVGYLGMYQSIDKKAENPISQDCFVLLQNMPEGNVRLLTNAPYTRCIYFTVLAKLLYEDFPQARKLYKKLTYGLKYNDPMFKNCFFEKNKQPVFETVVDLLHTKINEYLPVNGDNVFQVDGYDTSTVYKLINGGHLEDISGWVHLDKRETEGLSNWGKYLGIVDSYTEISKIEPPVVEVNTATATGASGGQNMMDEFLQKDWSIMSDEEAERLPEFLKIQRKAMHEFYESKKNTLSQAVALKIKEMHDGKLKTLSLSGPAGTGKTFAARMIAGALNLPLQIVVGKAGVDASEYLGSYQIVSHDGETNSIWKDGAISEVVRYGGILLFDEVNLAEPEVVGSLNTLLDISNCLCLSNGETLAAHPKFFYIEAMNIGSGFDGTNKMNNSHRRRMQRKMRFALPTKDEEIEILKETTGYKNEDVLSRLIDVENYIRSNIEDPTNQYMSISEVQGWISEAEYTGEWIQSACDTILAPLMEQDEAYADYSLKTIGQAGGFVYDVAEYIKDVLSDETYE